MLNFLFTKTPLMFLVESFWRDEAYSYLLAKHNLFDIAVLTAKDFNPPLYYFLLHILLPLTGKNEILIRLISTIPYLAMVYVGYLAIVAFCKNNRLTRFLYVVFFATAPIFILYAFEARMYSLLALCTLTSSYALLTKKPKLYIIATIVGLYTHYFMLLVVFTQFLFLILTGKRRFEWHKFILPALSLIAFNP